MRPRGRVASALTTGALGLGLGLTGACSSGTTYSYIDVSVMVDTSTFSADDLKRVGSCQVLIAGAEGPLAVSLGDACLPGQTQANLGTFEWTTTETKGWLTFEVFFYLFQTIDHPLAHGLSPQVDIVKGKHTSTTVIVRGIPDNTTPADAGTDGATSGADAAVDGNAGDAQGSDASGADANAPDAREAAAGDTLPADATAG